jgi:threonine/homoserine/homoserine lactone efflux protein
MKERAIIFSTCILVNFGADVGKVLLAEKLSKKLTQRNIELINKTSGLLLLIFGIALFFGVLYSVTN